jgi:hypothetical protein
MFPVVRYPERLAALGVEVLASGRVPGPPSPPHEIGVGYPLEFDVCGRIAAVTFAALDVYPDVASGWWCLVEQFSLWDRTWRPAGGKVRKRGENDGITRADAERGLRRLVEHESRRCPPAVVEPVRSVDEVIEVLRDRLVIQGARKSYQENCESMQRIHISPAIGSRRIDDVTRRDIERLARSMLARGLAPKTVRNVVTFLHSAFDLAVEEDAAATSGAMYTSWDCATLAQGRSLASEPTDMC